MANFTLARPGQINNAGDPKALFLKLYSGEVLTTFEEENVMLARTLVKTISHGKSASFPATGTLTGGYHTPGTEIVGQTANNNERVINIDDLLVAAVQIANIDEAMNHWDARSIYSREAGRFLAKTMDTKMLQTLLLAARATATVSGGFNGDSLIAATAGTDKTVLKQQFLTAAQKLDEKNVPGEDRYAVLRPAQYYLLLQDNEVISRDYDVAGSSRQGKVYGYAGFDIAKCNHIPNSNVAAVTGENNTYNGNFATTVCAFWQKGAIGTVKLFDLSSEMEYSVRHQSTTVLSKYAVGHGILRPECAIEIKTA